MPKRPTILVRELDGLADEIAEESCYEVSLRKCLKAKREATNEGNLTAAGNASRGAAECYRRLGRLAEAEQEYHNAAHLFEITSDQKGMAWTLFTYGTFLRQTSHFDSASQALSAALRLAKRCRDLPMYAYVLGGVAENHRIIGNYDIAYKQHVEVLRLFKSLDDVRGIVWALEGIGQMLKNCRRVREGLKYFDEAKCLALKYGDTRGLAYALKCRGECLSLLCCDQEAIEEVLYAIDLFTSIGLQIGRGYAFKALGDIFCAARQNGVAVEHYFDAARLFLNAGDARGIAYTFTALGALCTSVGSGDSGAACLAHSSNYFIGAKIRLGVMRGLTGMLDVAPRQIKRRKLRELLDADATNQLMLPSEVFGMSISVPNERRELVQAGWRLLTEYQRKRIRYKRIENAKVWNGAQYADCSSFVQHVLIEAGHDFARSGRLTTRRLGQHSVWQRHFEEISAHERRPGDVILESNRHMGIFTGVRNGKPTGLQMGVVSNASELIWNDTSGNEKAQLRFFRLNAG